MADSSLPDYQQQIDAYQHAFESEIRSMIACVPFRPGDRVLDVAGGAGIHAALIGEVVGPQGMVLQFDRLASVIELAADRNARGPVRHVVAALERVPFEPGSFDVAWCAQSLYSLPDPVEAVGWMVQAVRPGGLVAVLEDDTLHRLLLSWPVEIELAVRQAEFDRLVRDSRRPRKYFVGRNLRSVLRMAGLKQIESRAFATERHAPFSEVERTFLTEYLTRLQERIHDTLEPGFRESVDWLLTASSPGFLLNSDDAAMTMLDHVAWGRRPTQGVASE